MISTLSAEAVATKAELIEGMVILPSPTRHQHHVVPHSAVTIWLGVYSAAAPDTEVSNNVNLRIDQDNELQPDVLLRIVEAAGGSAGDIATRAAKRGA